MPSFQDQFGLRRRPPSARRTPGSDRCPSSEATAPAEASHTTRWSSRPLRPRPDSAQRW